MAHKVVPLKVYVSIFAALLVGTALTVGANFVHFGRFNLIIALLIAFTKASLVVLFFMHVKQSSPLTKVFVVSGMFWFCLLIAGTFADYASRDWLPALGAWENKPVLEQHGR
ncbi:MAG TPA: cytochrome C oxidase subunit IV family protein [Bryobacteraceae bacterium]|nr:cytochrome C oxidase subunit IV family protein [Bryobacteraceae bacterium]